MPANGKHDLMAEWGVQLRLMTHRERTALCLMLGAVVFLLFQTFQKAYRPIGYDFTSYLLSAEALWNGRNPYHTNTGFAYIYPLFLAFVLIPLTAVPYWLSNLLWFGLSIFCLLAGCLCLLKIAKDDTGTVVDRRLAVPALVLFLFFLSPIQSNLRNGQVNLIVLFCCVLFFRNWAQYRVVAGSAWLGAAIAIKLMPAVLLMFLVVRRQFRALAYTLCFAALFCMIPGTVAGGKLSEYYRDYAHFFLLPSLMASSSGAAPPVKAEAKESRPVPLSFTLQGAIQFVFSECKGSSWPKYAGLLITIAALFAVDVASVRSSWRQPHRDATLRGASGKGIDASVPRGTCAALAGSDVWLFCEYLLACLLISPMSETHHLVFVIPAAMLVGAKTWNGRRSAARSSFIPVAAFIVCFLLANVFKRTPLYFLSLLILAILTIQASRSNARVADNA